MRALGFCVSIDHARFMARVFNEIGDIGSERFDEALGGIRGALLDGAALEGLGQRLQQLLE
jgi:hypothetical protein